LTDRGSHIDDVVALGAIVGAPNFFCVATETVPRDDCSYSRIKRVVRPHL
jgi:hypothetical protein